MDELKLTLLRKGNFGSFKKPILEKIETSKKLQERLKKENEEEKEKRRLEEIERLKPKFYQCLICLRKFDLNEHHKYRRHIENLHQDPVIPTLENYLIEKIKPTYEIRNLKSAITTRHEIIFIINLIRVEVYDIDPYHFYAIFIRDVDKFIILPITYFSYWDIERSLIKIFNETMTISFDFYPIVKRSQFIYNPTDDEKGAINEYIENEMKEIFIDEMLVENNRIAKKLKELERDNQILQGTINTWKIDTKKEKGNILLRFMRKVIAKKRLQNYPEWNEQFTEITNKF